MMMKRKETRKLLLLGYFLISICVHAQEQKVDCKYHTQEALFYLNGSSSIAKDSLKAMAYLKPCLETKHATAQFIMGQALLNSAEADSLQQGFRWIQKAAKQKHPPAIERLGVLYKYGIACKLNFNKARRLFKKASKLGNDKAAYSLGYMYFKGLGNTKQDYRKAVEWFKKSHYPMATYWLGVCYLKGHGVPKDMAKATALLQTNYTEQETTENNTSAIETKATKQIDTLETHADNAPSNDITKENLYGKWTGQLLQLDWSGTHIENSLPLVFTLKHDSIQENIHYTWKLNSKEKTGNTILIDHALYFNNLQSTLPPALQLNKEQDSLDHALLSVEIAHKTFAGSNYLIGTVESYIPTWNEPSAPMRFVLTNQQITTENNVPLSAEILRALAAQEHRFIKVYPNPFQSDLIVAYTLKEPSHIHIELANISVPTQVHVIEKGTQQQAGAYRYYFDGSPLKKGIYVVRVFVNGEQKTKLILKK